MRNFIDCIPLFEDTSPDENGLYSFWGLSEQLGFDEDFKGEMGDKMIPWINSNATGKIDQMTRNKKMVLMSKLVLFQSLHGPKSYADKWATVEDFKRGLQLPLKLWRGGGYDWQGKGYDPDRVPARRNWVSYTYKPGRAKTFSFYDGTQATKAWRLPEREKWWVVEVDCVIDDILIYCFQGMDAEVLLPVSVSQTGRVIATHEGGTPPWSD